MKSPAPRYESYLLRMWRSSEGKAWRAMLESTRTNERYSFADLESLCAFLREQTGCGARPPGVMEAHEPDDL